MLALGGAGSTRRRDHRIRPAIWDVHWHFGLVADKQFPTIAGYPISLAVDTEAKALLDYNDLTQG